MKMVDHMVLSEPEIKLLGGVKYGYLDWVVSALEAGANPNAYSATGKPIFSYAVTGIGDLVTSEKIIDILLEHGALLELRCYDGRTPLMYAVKGNGIYAEDLLKVQLHIVKVLLARGASPNARDKEMNNPLFYLVYSTQSNAIEMAKLLIAHGADANARNTYGLSCWEIAESYHKYALAEFLKSHADILVSDYATSFVIDRIKNSLFRERETKKTMIRKTTE